MQLKSLIITSFIAYLVLMLRAVDSTPTSETWEQFPRLSIISPVDPADVPSSSASSGSMVSQRDGKLDCDEVGKPSTPSQASQGAHEAAAPVLSGGNKRIHFTVDPLFAIRQMLKLNHKDGTKMTTKYIQEDLAPALFQILTTDSEKNERQAALDLKPLRSEPMFEKRMLEVAPKLLRKTDGKEESFQTLYMLLGNAPSEAKKYAIIAKENLKQHLKIIQSNPPTTLEKLEEILSKLKTKNEELFDDDGSSGSTSNSMDES